MFGRRRLYSTTRWCWSSSPAPGAGRGDGGSRVDKPSRAARQRNGRRRLRELQWADHRSYSWTVTRKQLTQQAVSEVISSASVSVPVRTDLCDSRVHRLWQIVAAWRLSRGGWPCQLDLAQGDGTNSSPALPGRLRGVTGAGRCGWSSWRTALGPASRARRRPRCETCCVDRHARPTPSSKLEPGKIRYKQFFAIRSIDHIDCPSYDDQPGRSDASRHG